MQYTKASFFDLDKTLLKVNCSFRFGHFLYQKKAIPFSSLMRLFSSYILHKWGWRTPEQLNDSACQRFFSKENIKHVQTLVTQFLDHQFEEMLYYPAIDSLVRAHREGVYTVIISSSPDFLVEGIAQRLGVNEWLATEYAVDSCGQITHIKTHMDGERKAQMLIALCHRLNISIPQTVAYSDSFLDLPFLLAAGEAKGVNPDKRLKKYCLENNWEIL